MLSKGKLTAKSSEEINKLLGDAWLNIKVDESTLFNPLAQIPPYLEEEPHLYILWLMQQPEYFSFICRQVLNIQILPMQGVILKEIWNRKFPILIMSRGAGKSWLLALYALLRMILMPGRKIVICGGAFRQSKIIFNYMENMWYNAPIFRDMVGSGANGPYHSPDMFTFRLGESSAFAIPIGDGTKIRGLRAHDILSDEFSSISREIFETVIAGFGVVHSDPVEVVKETAKIKLSQQLGIKYTSSSDDAYKANQIIISGTAYYDFNHFGEYWKRWKAIIRSKGDTKRLQEIFRADDIPPDFNWRDYSIIRVPVDLLPKGFMDEGMIARSKATIHTGIYNMEYQSCFSNDSNGFFKRSLIESCVIRHDNEITLSSGKVDFRAVLRGDPTKEYVYGVDPASEVDNFAIIVLEARKDHSRIVYGWTTNRKEHREKIKAGLVKETDFYCYCARKIRELMKAFPCIRISMDSQGGGVSVIEALHDKDKIEEGEHQIWPIIDPEKPAPTDGEPGLHIVEMVNFSSSDWVSEANHGLRKDFEDKVCLFPFFDSATLGLAAISDEQGNRLYDSLEDCVMEIEELKDELSTIIVTQTTSGRDKWDTPEVKLPGNKKGRLRKDRYSSLLMANMSARRLRRNPAIAYETAIGGFAHSSKNTGGIEYIGPSWFTERMRGIYD